MTEDLDHEFDTDEEELDILSVVDEGPDNHLEDQVTEDPQNPPEPETVVNLLEETELLEDDHIEQEAADQNLSTEDVVGSHLAYIYASGEMTVAAFAAAIGLGNEARSVLDRYVAAGLLERGWRGGKGRYYLTKVGKAAIGAN